MREYLFFKLRYCWFIIICLFKVYSKVIQWFSLSGASLDKMHSLWEVPGPCPQNSCCCSVASVMSDSVRPHRPTRLPCPWDSPGKNTGVGCHFLLQCMKEKRESEVVQLCLTLRDPKFCSLSGSSIHGIFQARVLEWGAIAFSGLSTHTYKIDNWLEPTV